MMYSGWVSLKPPFPPLVRADRRAEMITTSSGDFGARAVQLKRRQFVLQTCNLPLEPLLEEEEEAEVAAKWLEIDSILAFADRVICWVLNRSLGFLNFWAEDAT